MKKSKILSYKANAVIGGKYCPYILVSICIKNKQIKEASDQHISLKHNEKHNRAEAGRRASIKLINFKAGCKIHRQPKPTS